MQKKLALTTKVLLSFIVMICSMICIGLTGIYSTKENYKNGNEIATINLPTINTLSEIKSSLSLIASEEKTLLLIGLRGVIRTTEYDSIEKELSNVEKLIKVLEGHDFTIDEKKMYEEFQMNYKEWLTQHFDLINYSKKSDEAIAAKDKVKSANYLEIMLMRIMDSSLKLNNTLSIIKKLTTYNIQEANELNQKIQKTYKVTSTFFISIVSVILILSIICLIYFMRLSKILSTTLNNSTNTITDESRKVAEGNQDLSSRTLEQATLLEETASTLEEITSQVKQTADHCQKVAQIAEVAVAAATKGLTVSEETKLAMSEISTSSKKISEIIGLVEIIAFQTNILAINAAIEAAKAGDQGKGFAVVAIEVRDLAQRAALATKEIKSLIDNSVEKVDNGEKLVSLNNDKLQEISANVNQVSGLMEEISVATREQFTSVDQINKAVIELDSVTQRNASLVAQIASSSEIVKNKTYAMNTLMKEIFSESQDSTIMASNMDSNLASSMTSNNQKQNSNNKNTNFNDNIIHMSPHSSKKNNTDNNSKNNEIKKDDIKNKTADEKDIIESILKKNGTDFSDGQDF
ncbi:MAG: MCP four helix bundle domain-containing protein [Oligoflexia bacterium]|nr:MCP four helix bundle domain-containing protein [Oligoflexia bacterium]